MDKTTKIALYSIGGLVLATGLFFGIRSIAKSNNEKKEGGLSASERRELEALRKKDADGGTLTPEQQAIIDKADGKYTPGEGETTTLGGCSFPLKNGDSCKEVAQIQLAINEKHNPGGLLSTQGNDYTWACLPSVPGQHSSLTVDGDLGPATAKQLGRWYGLCESSGFLWEVCDCKNMKISKGLFDNIISGADVSDEALKKAGFNSFSGYSEFSASTNYFNPTTPLNNNGYIEFNGSSNFNVPGFGKKYDSPLGSFYKSKFAFTDDYPKQSEMEHSYGMGKGFGFSGSTDLSFNGQKGTESEVQSVQEFFDECP